jgi:predicted nuclease of predicted toxin-antitoxin system
MRVLIDVNLAPAWAAFLTTHGIDAVHWTTVGDPRAADDEVMGYARARGYVVFTHDLDFGALLALTRAAGPSVVQIRSQGVLPEAVGEQIVRVLTEHAEHLERGALVTVDPRSARIRILPIR